MNALYGLIYGKQYAQTAKTIRKSCRKEALAVFTPLTIKEKCLYLIKTSKRNTAYQTIVLLGLALMVLTVHYLLQII